MLAKRITLDKNVGIESMVNVKKQLGEIENGLLVFDASNTDYMCAALIGLFYQLNKKNIVLVKHSRETMKLFNMLQVNL